MRRDTETGMQREGQQVMTQTHRGIMAVRWWERRWEDVRIMLL